MTKLLVLEASSEMCSVTLSTEKSLLSLNSNEPRSHSQLLLPYIDQLLNSGGVDLDELDFIGCSQGPGSFTGLRICFSVAQGLAYGAGLPLVMVCSLQSMAMSNQDKLSSAASFEHGPHITISVMDARMNQVYWAAYQHNTDGGVDELEVMLTPRLQDTAETCMSITQFIQRHPSTPISVVGSGMALLDLSPDIGSMVRLDGGVTPLSAMSAKLALKKWDLGLSVAPGDAELVYLRDTVSWKKRIRIRS